MRLVWRVFLANAAVLVTATVVLAVSPATVSFPIGAQQALELAVGLAVLLAVDFWVLRKAFEPFQSLVRFMRRVDPLRPGQRAHVIAGDADVALLAGTFNEMLERVERERRDSAARALSATEAERRRVAADLHDEVGQLLTAGLLQLDELERGVGGVNAVVLARARQAVAQALDETRAIGRRLRPVMLDDLGLESALVALSVSMAGRSQVRVTRRIAPEALDGLSPEQELVIYRIAQESLTNIARHARASDIWIAATRHDGVLELCVEDNGDARAPLAQGAGIRGMRERALLIGATVEITTRDPSGVRVTLRVPTEGAAS